MLFKSGNIDVYISVSILENVRGYAKSPTNTRFSFYKHRGYKHHQAQIWLRFLANFKKIVVRKEIATWKVSVTPQKHFKHTIRGRVGGEIGEILPQK